MSVTGTVRQADLIVFNGRVLTMDDDLPAAEAVAVKDGAILAVGSRAAIEALKGPATKVIDAKGGSVIPGFIEAHMHLFSGAAELAHLQLIGVHGFDALRDAVRAYAAKRPDAPMLVAQSADYTILGDERVTRHHLDAILPDRPFCMAAPDHHTMWANTKALEAAGVLHGRALGPGNEIVMGEDGLAEGELREGEAFGPVLALADEERVRLGLSTGGEPDPAPTPAQRAADRDIMRRGLAWCAEHGITSIQNMDGNLYQLELLAEIEAEEGLSCRVKMPFHFKNFMKLEMLEKASTMATRYDSEWLSSRMVKVFYDGVLDSWTAVMVEPYADRLDWVGEPLFTPASSRNWPSPSMRVDCRSRCMRSGMARSMPCSTATKPPPRPMASATAATASSISRWSRRRTCRVSPNSASLPQCSLRILRARWISRWSRPCRASARRAGR
jgi:predicted amidohydrolase YtcJ